MCSEDGSEWSEWLSDGSDSRDRTRKDGVALSDDFEGIVVGSKECSTLVLRNEWNVRNELVCLVWKGNVVVVIVIGNS